MSVKSTTRDLPNLDLLRSIAVTLVIVNHTLLFKGWRFSLGWDFNWFGVVGVYMFFVHTCLVLMWSLERKPHTLDFYIRRVFRIYPLAIAAVFATVLLFSHLPQGWVSPYEAHPHLPDIVANVALMNNVVFHANIMGVMWSLPLEVQMYLFLPVLFFFVRSNFALWPMLLIWTFSVVFARHYFPSYSNEFGTVIPDFLPGVMAYILFSRHKPAIPAWLFVPFLAILVVLYMHQPTVRHGWFFCLALGLGLPFFHQIRSAWLRRLSHTIAKYSYGIYLMHPFCIVLGIYVLRGYPFALQLTVELGAVALLAFVAYHLIEKPMVRVGSRLAAQAEFHYEQHELSTHSTRRNPVNGSDAA